MPTLTDKVTLSFGRYLQAIRLEKGISLEAVSKETRIRKDVLLFIEEENHAKLPDAVFVSGFIRAYAKSIGADGDEAIRRYRSRLEVIQKIAKSENELKQSQKKFWPRLLFSIGTLLCLIILSVLAVSVFRKPYPTGGQVEPQEQQQDIRVNKMAITSNTSPAEVAIEKQIEEKRIVEKFLLKIITIEETWIKVIIDNHARREYSLNPGDQIELGANSGYNLLIGNAGGIQLLLNDKPIELPGASGQVVNIQIP
ncbi:MAG: DUF4115 domain-containing protein [Deltaproteobacteria bacterium]|nr:MAG: DUF4115 domain-containing protein [Deltaproteobacteria bacterium]